MDQRQRQPVEKAKGTYSCHSASKDCPAGGHRQLSNRITLVSKDRLCKPQLYAAVMWGRSQLRLRHLRARHLPTLERLTQGWLSAQSDAHWPLGAEESGDICFGS